MLEVVVGDGAGVLAVANQSAVFCKATIPANTSVSIHTQVLSCHTVGRVYRDTLSIGCLLQVTNTPADIEFYVGENTCPHPSRLNHHYACLSSKPLHCCSQFLISQFLAFFKTSI